MTRTMMLGAAALAAGLGTAGAQDAMVEGSSMNEYNTNDDGYISSAEFAAHAAPEFDLYDIDQSGGITPEEFAAGEITRYDEDEDAMLDEAEYAASRIGIDPLRYMGEEPEGLEEDPYPATTVGIEPLQHMGQEPSEADDGSLAAVDTDSDAMIDRDEYAQSVQGAFEAFDQDGDGELSPQELGEAQFGRFDVDNDGQLGEEEFRAWTAYPALRAEG